MATASPQTNPLSDPQIRVTDTHIYFLGGILSNWHPSPSPFSGGRALSLCLPKLDSLNISHPPPNAVSTKLIQTFPFRRGEQWMMALKAWLFDRTATLGESIIPENKDGDEALTNLRRMMLNTKPPRTDTKDKESQKKKELWESPLCRILRSNSPKSQKSLGRKVKGFREDVWGKVSGEIVVAGCVARAQVDEKLKGLYLGSGERVFVEGSSRDRVWGVGLDWKSEAILDEENWEGTNRLGECHGKAAKILRAE